MNSYGEIIRKEILEKDIKTIYDYEFKNNGNLLSQTTKTEFMKLKSIYHYTNNYLSKIEHYESINNSDLKLKSIIKYDENFNALNEKYFEMFIDIVSFGRFMPRDTPKNCKAQRYLDYGR